MLDVLYELDALTIRALESQLADIQDLPYVEAANPDAERKGSPIDTVFVEDFMGGYSTWNLDVINVTEGPGAATRVIPQTGDGIYVAVLDTGLVSIWRQYFPEERIATEFAISFGGGGGLPSAIPEQPNKWEHDTSSHGTHATSTIIGYDLWGGITGVAPEVKIIPVKVLNQNGSGWSSVIAHGIKYVANLKLSGALGDSPVVINMSLGGPVLDAVEKAALDYAMDAGVIIVTSAGNEGPFGMGYPAAYEPIISVASSGWVGEWMNSYWWYGVDDPEPNNVALYTISDFSSRALPGQDLDVAAPGSWIVGPYNISQGQRSFYFLGGTSMASPHVAGIVALMLEKNPGLVQADVEAILEDAALDMGYLYEEQGEGLITADGALLLVPVP